MDSLTAETLTLLLYHRKGVGQYMDIYFPYTDGCVMGWMDASWDG